MENQNGGDFDKLSKELEVFKSTLSNVISLLVSLNSAINDGFDRVNERLSSLEGKQGMQGVNTQLHEIKLELNKIQKTYPYDDMFKNLQSISGVGNA